MFAREFFCPICELRHSTGTEVAQPIIRLSTRPIASCVWISVIFYVWKTRLQCFLCALWTTPVDGKVGPPPVLGNSVRRSVGPGLNITVIAVGPYGERFVPFVLAGRLKGLSRAFTVVRVS